jgi:signal transduction histidine kinase
MHPEDLAAALGARREQIEAEWTSALARTGVTIPDPAQLPGRLRALTSQLIDTLAAPDLAGAAGLGRAIVRAGLGHPEALAASLDVLRAALWEGLPDPVPRQAAQRVEGLLSALAAGLYQAAGDARRPEPAPDPQALNAALVADARRKDELISVLSHELRTPLSIILGLAELLTDGVYGPVSEAQKLQIGQIERSGRHLLGFVNDVLDLAHLSAGLLDLHHDVVDVRLLCEMSLAAIAPEAQGRAIALDLDLDLQAPTISADTRRLQDILTRLLSNAVRFTPDGGRAGLSVRDDTAMRRVYFTVWDSGSGVVPDDMGRLFRPFEQLDSGMARRGGGLGLGLALVASLTHLHGGGVSVESVVGQGNRFGLWLPWGGERALVAGGPA